MSVLVVAAHPDDELLGCGGAIMRHTLAGEAVHILILAEGGTSRGPDVAAYVAQLQDAARAVARSLGAESPRFCGFPDNRMDSVPLLDVVKRVEACVAEVLPAIVYCHYFGDLNIDHRITHQAVVTACRPLPGRSVRAVYAFEVPSSTEWGSPTHGPGFRPTRYVGIDAVLERKKAALAHYGDEIESFPHPRSPESVEHLARRRGAECGLRAAEAFELIRAIEP